MEVESRIAEVTLYAGGARVRRVTTILLGSDAPRVRIVGLPAAMIDDTVRIEAEGGAVVTAVHVGLEAPARDAAADEDTPEVRAGRHRVAFAEAEVERLDAALAVLAAAPIALPPPPSDEPLPAWSATVDARRALVAVRTERELALRDQAASARRQADAARRALGAAVDRDRRAGSARAARLHELRKHVELELVGAGSVTVHLEYQVAAARWAPSYVARLDGEQVVLELRATIAQDTGEDWTGVALRLSTAEPERFGALPELAAQRIGRRQADPARTGFRAPPVGAAALYLDYLRALPAAEPAHRGSGRPGTFATEAAPPPRQALSPAATRNTTLLGGAASYGVAGGTSRARAASPPPPPPGPARLDYGNLRMAPPGAAERGTLVAAPRDRRIAALDGEVATAAAHVNALELPIGCSADWPHTYDYAFTADGTVDVRADGGWHSIAVTAKPSTAKLRHVAVPREQADVFRIAAVVNPLAGPLLPGPIDVYDRGTFVITSAALHTPPGATVEIGLGVDAAIKLSRNTKFHEEPTGVLRGGLRLHHAIQIDVQNLSDRPIDLEVRERLPVTREDDGDVEVDVVQVDPVWERWTPDPDAAREHRLRGGFHWRLFVPAGGKRALHAAYEVKIAGKLELVGGNRREP
jgi:hypothetical protein